MTQNQKDIAERILAGMATPYAFPLDERKPLKDIQLLYDKNSMMLFAHNFHSELHEKESCELKDLSLADLIAVYDNYLSYSENMSDYRLLTIREFDCVHEEIKNRISKINFKP